MANTPNRTEKAGLPPSTSPPNMRWEILLSPLMEEYKMLWAEMNNRWAQQQNIIATSWTVIAATIAFVGVLSTKGKESPISETSVVELLLLPPLALYFLYGVLIRHDDKNSRILAYLYVDLRPRVQNLINAVQAQSQANTEPITIWQWPNFELKMAQVKKGWSAPFHFLVDGSRYLMMLAPSVLLLIWAGYNYRTNLFLLNRLFSQERQTIGLMSFLFWLDVFGLVIALILGKTIVDQIRRALEDASR